MKLSCGCKADTARWLVMCQAHTSEHEKIHKQWMEDYRNGQSKASSSGGSNLGNDKQAPVLRSDADGTAGVGGD
jgi:hypothetical protein